MWSLPRKRKGNSSSISTNLTDANGMIQLFKQKYPFINVNLFAPTTKSF